MKKTRFNIDLNALLLVEQACVACLWNGDGEHPFDSVLNDIRCLYLAVLKRLEKIATEEIKPRNTVLYLSAKEVVTAKAITSSAMDSFGGEAKQVLAEVYKQLDNEVL